jgi:hypothetical protein
MSYEQTKNTETQLSSQEVLQAGAEFLEHFGVQTNPAEQPEQFLEAMAQLDPRYQGGRELVRFELEADQTDWPEETKQIIMRAAESMRMLDTETPLIGDYKVVIALGGARQSNLDRTRYAAVAAESEQATFGELVVAGSIRKLNDAEKENVKNYAPEAETEADLCAAAASTVGAEHFGLKITHYAVFEERAGTPRIIESLLENMITRGEITENAKIAAVTTQIYQASTELDLARVAKQFGITETFTAGNPSDPKVIEARTPATYLSEVLRTLKAAALAAQAEK